MYTSYDKISDRFGFNTGGTFKCAYKNTRVIITAGIVTIGVIMVCLIISIVYVMVRMKDVPSMASAQLDALIGTFISGEGIQGDTKAGSALMSFGITVVSISFGVLLLMIAVIAFLITIAVLRSGQTYKFRADEEKFTVIYPKSTGGTLTMEYSYIEGVQAEEWKFLCSPKCLDITVQTKNGDFTFRVLHTPMSKANGICETPFNIIREKIGLSKEADIYLVHKTEGRI